MTDKSGKGHFTRTASRGIRLPTGERGRQLELAPTMPHYQNAIRAVRSSHGYVFSVVACAAVLVMLAVIQCLRPGSGSPEHIVVISATADSSSDLPLWRESDLASEITSDAALAEVRTHIATAAAAVELPADADLRKSIALIVPPDVPQNQRRLRLVCVATLPHGELFVHYLAERFVDQTFLAPRDIAADSVRTSEAALATLRGQHTAAAGRLRGLEGELAQVTTEFLKKQADVAESRRQLNQAVGQSPPPTPAAQPDRELEALTASLAAVQTQRVQLLSQYTPRHPLVQDVDNRIAEISAAIASHQPPAVQTSPMELSGPSPRDEAAGALAAIEGELQQLQDRLSSMELDRDQQAATIARLEEEMRTEDARLNLARADLERLQAIELDIANVPASAASLRQVGPFGLLFSLALGCILGCFASMKSSPVVERLTSQSDIESILALPVIGLLSDTDDAAVPAAEDSLRRSAHVVRLAAELALGLFLLAVGLGVVAIEHYPARLSAEPLSATADSLRQLARGVWM